MRLGELGVGRGKPAWARRSLSLCQNVYALAGQLIASGQMVDITHALPSMPPPSAGTSTDTIASDAATEPAATSDDFNKMLQHDVPCPARTLT